MDALQLLQNRVSITKLVSPAPSHLELLDVFKAAARAPDHGKLQSWRFLTISGVELNHLSDVFVESVCRSSPDASPAIFEKTKNMPFRAPMIIVAIAKCQEHVKVPRQEQIIACGAATQNMLNALFALNYGAVWRTGELAYDSYVKESLGLSPAEEIIGFIYVGTPVLPIPAAPQVDAESIFGAWHPN